MEVVVHGVVEVVVHGDGSCTQVVEELGISKNLRSGVVVEVAGLAELKGHRGTSKGPASGGHRRCVEVARAAGRRGMAEQRLEEVAGVGLGMKQGRRSSC